jgi:hypothetical protein
MKQALATKSEHFALYLRIFGACIGVLAVVGSFLYTGWIEPKESARDTKLEAKVNARMDRHKEQWQGEMNLRFGVEDDMNVLKFADREEFIRMQEVIMYQRTQIDKLINEVIKPKESK